jgi:hypothetical protein
MSLLYEPLDVESYEVRILCLHPDPPGSIIRCTLQKQSLFHLPTYTALSYCWGDELTQRDIIVNNIRTPVTVNLEEALQQLRQMNVTRVWADALCINQRDKQEKSIQIRNMKQIYSKSDMTYAWLGGQDADAAVIAIQFLRNISTNAVALEDIPHAGGRHQNGRHIWHLWRRHHVSPVRRQPPPMNSVHGSGPRLARCDDQCQRCVLESGFRGLVDLCDHPYWKRRWVIQEVTAAAQVQIVCGKESLTLEHMTTALDNCLSSKYWLVRNEVSHRYMKRILDFRNSYLHGQGSSLCEAILATREFLSKDVRDKVFALIGVCTDGAELVPTPNYLQSPETIARDISRELLRRNLCYDIILVDERRRCTSTALPTWAPDWLSSTLPEDAASIAKDPPRLRHSIGSQFLMANADSLRLEGVMLGTVVGMTSTFGPGLPTQGALAAFRRPTGSLDREHLRYYGWRSSHVKAAILRCLIGKDGATSLHLLRRFVRDGIDFGSALTNPGENANGPASVVYRQWMEANADFPIHGYCLRHWLTENRMQYFTLRLTDTYWGRGLLVLALAVTCTIPTLLLKGIPRVVICALVWTSGFMITVLALLGFRPAFIREMKRPIRKAMQVTAQSSKRLVVLNKGLLGMVCPDTEVGDKICFLAGCTDAAVLRQGIRNGVTQYQVVGKASVCLSKRDKKKYRAFVKDRLVKVDLYSGAYDEAADREEYSGLMEKYKRRDWWQEFLLV